FFSSRRRHTRFSRDWSSDVCSSDLEPDILWEKYILEVKEMVRRMGVGLTVGAHGIPMAAPHTRPMTTTVHGTRQDLLPDSASFQIGRASGRGRAAALRGALPQTTDN